MSAPHTAAYLAELALGPELLYEPRREDCPWCGSTQLRTRVLDECQDCGHVFRNPGLTAEGLACHLRDRHDERGGRGARLRHRFAARAMTAFPEPESWLDVGTGEGHFPRTAKEFFPYTSFDGLDATPRVERARAAGHVEEATVGQLTNRRLTARLRARYDVVSLLHHLPLARDPREELRAALTVLRPGGHLLLEAPDPGCLPARLLAARLLAARLLGGRLPRARTGHLHLLPLDNLHEELRARGCTVLTPLGRPRVRGIYRVIARKDRTEQSDRGSVSP